MDRRLEEIDPLEEKFRGATPKEEEDRTVEETLLAHLDPVIEQRLITDVLRPIKTGKEAVVYCCLAHPTLDRELVAAKVYRPFETRSFKQDAIYQQGRERGSRPDARVCCSLTCGVDIGPNRQNSPRSICLIAGAGWKVSSTLVANSRS